MLVIPQIIDPSVPLGPDDSANVEVQRFGEPKVPDFEIPYHTELMESFDGIDMDAAGRVSGNGFYYLLGDIARLHEAVLAYGRDFMIDKGFTYCIPPFMIHGNVGGSCANGHGWHEVKNQARNSTSRHLRALQFGRFIDRFCRKPCPRPYLLLPLLPKEKGPRYEERGISVSTV